MSIEERNFITLCEIINEACTDNQKAVQDRLEKILIGFNLGWDARSKVEIQESA